MKNPSHKVAINRGAVQELALYGSSTALAPLIARVQETLKRLGAKRFKGVLPFKKILPYEGGRPSVIDIGRWLDDLQANDARYVEDIDFLKSLHVTLQNRDFTPPPDDEE